MPGTVVAVRRRFGVVAMLWGGACLIQPDAGVANGQQQVLAALLGAHLDAATLDLGLQAMADAVFHQGLQ